MLTYATSAATAQAARMAAIIKAQYPPLWPETVRGLIVHSAEWTRAMQGHLRGAGGKRKREMLVRRYGFGVPRLSRALRSASDSLTLIAQGSIRPFVPGKDPKKRSMGDIHFFDLPWPTEVLQSLGEQPVRLRVTLSYFIEPNPGRRGWTKRHRYASHGLRFDVKGPTESLDEFRKRLNQQALEEDEDKPKADGPDGWYPAPRPATTVPCTQTTCRVSLPISPSVAWWASISSAAGGRTSPPATAAPGAPATPSSSRSKPTRRTSTSGHRWQTRLACRS